MSSKPHLVCSVCLGKVYLDEELYKDLVEAAKSGMGFICLSCYRKHSK